MVKTHNSLPDLRENRNVQLLINIFEAMKNKKTPAPGSPPLSSIELLNGHVAATVAKFERSALIAPVPQPSGGPSNTRLSPNLTNIEIPDEDDIHIEIVEFDNDNETMNENENDEEAAEIEEELNDNENEIEEEEELNDNEIEKEEEELNDNEIKKDEEELNDNEIENEEEELNDNEMEEEKEELDNNEIKKEEQEDENVEEKAASLEVAYLSDDSFDNIDRVDSNASIATLKPSQDFEPRPTGSRPIKVIRIFRKTISCIW